MNLPLTMRCNVVENQGTALITLYKLVHLVRIQLVLVCNKRFPEVKVLRMIQIEVLTACQCPPWYPVLSLQNISAVATLVKNNTCPDRGSEPPLRLCNNVLIGNPHVLCRTCQFIRKTMPVLIYLDLITVYGLNRLFSLLILLCMKTGVVLFYLPCLEVNLTMGQARRVHYHGKCSRRGGYASCPRLFYLMLAYML